MYTNSNDNRKLSIVFMSNKPDISSTLYNVALTLLHTTSSGSSTSFQEGKIMLL